MLGLFVFVACDSVVEDPDTYESEVVEESEESEAEIEDEATEEPEESAEIEEDENEPAVVGDFTSFAQFLTLNMGMSIDEVEEIMGEPMSSTSMDLLDVESTTNIWMDISLNGSTSTTVTFSDGYATSIMESSADSSDVSMADYDEISTGMTEVAVYEILGAPYSVTVMEILGTTSTTVSWINRDFSSIIITFTDGTAISSLQSNLD